MESELAVLKARIAAEKVKGWQDFAAAGHDDADE